MADLITQFHFLRPLWLLLIIPCVLLTVLLWRHQQSSGSWQKVIAPELLSHLIQEQLRPRQRWPLTILAGAWVLGCLALAGPAWQQISTPVSKSQQPLVVVVDLSYKQYTADLSPNRLTRLRYKLTDLFRLRTDGLTGVVAFAGGAHAVAPLTDDSNTLKNLVPALSPDIMPEQGQNPLAGVELAIQLLSQGAAERGDILLLTDSIPGEQISGIEAMVKQSGHALSALGLGSEQGAPISLPGGGYLKDQQGTIIVPRLERNTLQSLAQNAGGQYRDVSLDNNDLLALLPKPGVDDATIKVERQFDQWHDAGYWLIWLLLPLSLLGFRKGWLMLAVICISALPGQEAMAFEWNSLWQNRDQRAMTALQENNPEQAANLFRTPNWKAEALYRNQAFDQSAELFAQSGSANGFYNQGNALAHAGKLEEAISAYEQALKLNPDMEDAKFNKELLEKLKQQQEQQQEQQQPKQQQPSEDQQQPSEDQQQPSENQQQPSEDQQGSDSQQKQEQKSDSSGQESQTEETQSSQQQSSSQNQNSEQEREPQQQKTSEAQESKPEDNAARQAQDSQMQEQEQDQQAAAQAMGEDDQPRTPDQQAVDNWLNTIPDEPGGLLRRKFLQQQQRQEQRLQERVW